MQCMTCRTVLPDAAKFCIKCGITSTRGLPGLRAPERFGREFLRPVRREAASFYRQADRRRAAHR